MMQIISRKEAKAKGLHRYYTGKRCKYGHCTERYTVDGCCVTCSRIKTLKFYHAKKIKCPDWYSTHRVQKKKYDTYYRESKKNDLLWVAKERARSAAKDKRRALRTPTWLTDDDFAYIQDIYKLAKAVEEFTGVPHHVDHIIPLQGDNVCGLHVPDNLQLLTATENLQKGNSYGR